MHNVFSNYDGQVFDLHLYASQITRRVVFRRAGVCRVFCNIHPEMRPRGPLPDSKPAGAYRLQVWHERSLTEKLQELERRVTLGDGIVNAGEITVSEKRYVAQRHKNKFGQE